MSNENRYIVKLKDLIFQNGEASYVFEFID